MDQAVTTRFLRRLLAGLLPWPCLGCGRGIQDRGLVGLCPRCAALLAPTPRGKCWVCAQPMAPGEVEAGRCCAPCALQPRPFERLHAVWWYRFPCDAVIRGLKFRGLDYLADELGALAGKRFGSQLGGLDGVVAVPLHWFRRLGRGYDQAELLAKAIGRAVSLPCLDALRRTRLSRPQSAKPRSSRLRSPRGAYRLARGLCLQGKRLLLVDDVMTTGATLEAAAQALLAGGALEVVALTLARTPLEPRERVGPSSPLDNLELGVGVSPWHSF